MRLSDAERKSRKQILWGWLITLMGFLLLCMTATVVLYWVTEYDDSPFRPFTILLHNLAAWVYIETWFLRPIWWLVPELNVYELLDVKNLKVFTVFAVFMFGVIVKDSGHHLAGRVRKVKQRAEEKIWEKSLTGEQINADIMAMEITIESKDSWYTRPLGLVTLAIVGGYSVDLLGKLTGL